LGAAGVARAGPLVVEELRGVEGVGLGLGRDGAGVEVVDGWQDRGVARVEELCGVEGAVLGLGGGPVIASVVEELRGADGIKRGLGRDGGGVEVDGRQDGGVDLALVGSGVAEVDAGETRAW